MKNNLLFISKWGLAMLALVNMHTVAAEDITCDINSCTTQPLVHYHSDGGGQSTYQVVAPTLTVDAAIGAGSGSHDSNSHPTGNTLTLSGVPDNMEIAGVYGAIRIDNTAVKGNQVNLNGVDSRTIAIGGSAALGIAGNNRVTINHSYTRSVVGGTSFNQAIGNRVTINHSRTGYVYGGESSGQATGNRVTINYSIADRIYGGYSSSSNTSDNHVAIRRSVVENRIYGALADDSATNNHVTIDGGLFWDRIHGARSFNGNATNNHVTLRGGSFYGSVYGGRSSQGNATNNTITLQTGNYGKPTFAYDYEVKPVSLYGGIDNNTHTANDVKTGNALQVETTDISVNNIANFEHLRFYVQSDTVADTTFLTLTDTRAKGTDISQTHIGICVPTGIDSPLNVGDKLTLVTAKNLTTDTTLSNNVSSMAGCESDYAFSLAKVGNAVVATVTGITSTNPIIFKDSFETPSR